MLLVLLAVFFADPSPDPGPRLTCAFPRGKGEAFSHRPTPAGHELTITCAGGIGEARVRVAEGELPGTVVVRLAGLRALEGFTVVDGARRLHGGVNVGGTAFGNAVDRAGKETKDPKAAAVTLSVAATKGGYAATLTYAPGVSPGKELDIQWIDHYRR